MEKLLITWAVLMGLWLVWQFLRLIGKVFSAIGGGICAASESRAATLAQAKLDQEQAKHKSDKQRRENALAALELVYQAHGHAIQARLPRAALDEWIKTFLGPDTPIDILEHRALQMQGLIIGHVHAVDSPDKKMSAQMEKANARAEAMMYYDANAELLQTIYPVQLFRSQLELATAGNLEPGQCWTACNKLIDHLRILIAQEHDRRRAEAEKQLSLARRRQDIDRQIADLQQEIQQMRDSPLEADIVENEIHSLRRQIRILERERDQLR